MPIARGLGWLTQLNGLTVDLLVVGGGIHGTGIARDAAGRGLKVLLVEQGDLAGATSSASSKLAHGGLRYLELGDFRLVREALRERETLMRIAPHLVQPLSFFVPCGPGTRPRWQLRAGLFLYDWLSAGGSLPRSRALDLSQSQDGSFLQAPYRRGLCYYDGWADDARLAVANALDAAARGAIVMTHARCSRAAPSSGGWVAEVVAEGTTTAVAARALVNAAGPWVERFLRECTPVSTGARMRLIQGSHLVVRRRPPGGRALLLQNDDRRVVFVLPFGPEHALIGTTDVPLDGDPGQATISQAEVDYLCRAVNRYLSEPVRPDDVIGTLTGVRALHDDREDDPSRVTRDYLLRVDFCDGGAPVLSIFGGKLTTYRRLAEEALSKLRPLFPAMAPAWTAGASLPGGDLGGAADIGAYVERLRAQHPGLPAEWIAGIARRHGSLAEQILRGAQRPEQLGTHFGAGLTACEVEYLCRREWAREPDDVLWRRTKAGLYLTDTQREALARHLCTLRAHD
jgi:glycerol-3-phosphate dehydrogenase